MLAISIDVGGTLTKSAVVDEAGQALHELTEPTASTLPPMQVPDHVADLVQRLMAESGLALADLAGICVGLPGIVEHRLGLALSCPNLRNWEGLPLADLVTRRTGVTTWVERDANLAALGEAWIGAARGTGYSVCFTLGTGIGAGIILDGRLYRGSWGGAGEIGHITVVRDGPRCACGNRGCLEALASASAVAREAQAAAVRAPESLLWTLAGGERAAITADLVFRAALEGDATAMRVADTAVEYLGIGVATVINVFNLDMVVLAGGMAAAGSQVLDPVRAVVRQRARQPLAARSRVELGHLGGRAGVLGGARLVHLRAN
jgi:glucokinase